MGRGIRSEEQQTARHIDSSTFGCVSKCSAGSHHRRRIRLRPTAAPSHDRRAGAIRNHRDQYQARRHVGAASDLAARQPPQGEARWVGLTGGVQPPSFRARAWGVLGVLILVITVAAWFTSRWVARPMARLSQQVDAISRGEVPAEAVRGAREIERLGTALAMMARQRAAFDEQRRVMLMGVSHDLRSPLTRIRVAADLLSEQAPLRDLIVARRARRRDHRELLSYVRTDAEGVEDTVDLKTRCGQCCALADACGSGSNRTRCDRRGNATMLQAASESA